MIVFVIERDNRRLSHITDDRSFRQTIIANGFIWFIRFAMNSFGSGDKFSTRFNGGVPSERHQ